MYLPYLEIIDFYSVETHFSTPNVFSFLTFDLCISRAAHSPPSTNRIHILNFPTSVELISSYHSEGMLPPHPVWFHWILGKVSEFCLWALSNNSLVDALCLPIWWGLYVSLFDEAFMSPYLIPFSMQIWRGKDQENASKEFHQRKMESCLSTMNPMPSVLTSCILQTQWPF